MINLREGGLTTQSMKAKTMTTAAPSEAEAPPVTGEAASRLVQYCPVKVKLFFRPSGAAARHVNLQLVVLDCFVN